VAQDAADIRGGLSRFDIELDEGVASVAQTSPSEVGVTGEERGPAKAVQQRNNFAVAQSLPPYVDADLAHGNVPADQQLPLRPGQVLVQEVHADTEVTAYSSK
jgi:hypothetical protein